jgi:hypothetical protein
VIKISGGTHNVDPSGLIAALSQSLQESLKREFQNSYGFRQLRSGSSVDTTFEFVPLIGDGAYANVTVNSRFDRSGKKVVAGEYFVVSKADSKKCTIALDTLFMQIEVLVALNTKQMQAMSLAAIKANIAHEAVHMTAYKNLWTTYYQDFNRIRDVLNQHLASIQGANAAAMALKSKQASEIAALANSTFGKLFNDNVSFEMSRQSLHLDQLNEHTTSRIGVDGNLIESTNTYRDRFNSWIEDPAVVDMTNPNWIRDALTQFGDSLLDNSGRLTAAHAMEILASRQQAFENSRKKGVDDVISHINNMPVS